MKTLSRFIPILFMGSLTAAEAGQITTVPLGTHAAPVGAPPWQSAALLSDGRFAALWLEGNDGTTAFLQYIDSNGALSFRRPGIAVATRSSLLEAEAVMVAHARDGVLVAVRRKLDETSARIAVQWFDGRGRPRWGAGALAAPVARAEDQRYPYLLASPDGGAFVCFLRHAYDLLASPAIFCQRFSPEGRRLWGTGGAKTTRSPLLAEEPKALAASDGGLLVFWRDFGRPWRQEDATILRGQRLGPDGDRLWGDEARIISKTDIPAIPGGGAIDLRQLAVVSDGSGGAILAYDDQSRPLAEGIDFNRVTAQRMSGAGEKLWGDGIPVLLSRPPHLLDSLYPGPEGGAFVAVVRFPFSIDDPGGLHLVFQRLAADGRLLWPAAGVPVADPAVVRERDSDGPAFGAFDGDALQIAWAHYPLASRSSEIFFTVLDPAGDRLTGPAGIPLTNQVGRKGVLGFAYNPATGSSFVLWADSRAMGLVYSPTP